MRFSRVISHDLKTPVTFIKTIACFCAVIGVAAGLAGPARAAFFNDGDKQVAASNNAFAAGLYQQLRGQDGNLFFSPQSVFTALTMAYAGASGDTATEMKQVLHLTLEPDKLHPAAGAILRGLNEDGKGGDYTLSIADALWVEKNHPVQGRFHVAHRRQLRRGRPGRGLQGRAR